MTVKEYLFQDFLENPEVYDEAQAFWRSLCQRVLVKYGWSDLWEPFPDEFRPGTNEPVRDGNPIYSLINPAQLKSVLIIQQDPKVHTKWDMAGWVNLFGDEYSEPGPIRELVYTCNLTDKTAAAFEKLFETWIQPATQISDIEEQIDEAMAAYYPSRTKKSARHVPT